MRKLLLALVLLYGPALWAHGSPNLVLIIADDCTFRDLRCYGGQAHTPHLDRLASEGMRFTHCFQAAPMCSPTRHNIYTGLYPVKSGAYPNHAHANPGVRSIAHYLAPLGYRVMLSGKSHVGPQDVFPFEYTGGKNPDLDAIDQLFSEAAAKDEPFCLLACSNEPHTPWNKGDPSRYPTDTIELPPYIVDTPRVREDFRDYLAEITYFDSQVGQILARLKSHGLSDNTLVMVLSEQGNAFPFAKWTCYDSGLQSAMIVRWPQQVPPNTVASAMVEYVDILPTFLEAVAAPAVAELDGLSFLPVLRGKASSHKTHVFGIMTTRGILDSPPAYAIRSIRSDQFKLIRNLHHETKFTNACTQSPLFRSMVQKASAGDATAQRLVDAYQHRPAVELYNVQTDPLEQHNLAADPEYQPVIANLGKRLDRWMHDQGDQGVETEMQAFEHQAKARKSK